MRWLMPIGCATTNVTGLLVPSADVTVRSRGPGVAAAVTVSVADAIVGVIKTTLLTVMPLPASVIPARKRVPVSVTVTVEPGAAKFGVIPVMVGVLIDRV